MRKLRISAAALLIILAGCAHNISAPSRALVDRSVTFRQLIENPYAYHGKMIMLGGTVAAVEHTREGTRLEVIEHRLDSRELPDESVSSRGRFLATTPESLDSAKFEPGTLVTMAGEVVGQKSEKRQGVVYTYPLIAIREIHDIVIEQETHWGSFGGM